MKRRTVLAGLVAGGLAAPAAMAAPLASPAPGAAACIRLDARRLGLLGSTVRRLDALQRLVGYGNFNLLGFDDAIRHARSQPGVGRFTREELAFVDDLFATDARSYGFHGAKVFTELTTRVPRREVVKVRGSGHYLYRGRSLGLYRRVRREVGDSLVLTSGIRGIVKQIHLFLRKAVETGGDLSTASRSLAPPGHSYHGIGDFDVGKRGFGRRNFTPDFAATDEFRRLTDLGYVAIRYPHGNPFGVRFEPWHIKVV